MKPIKQFCNEMHGQITAVTRDMLRDAGYIPVNLNHNLGVWGTVHDWCQKNLGAHHYTWTGSTFWFDDPEKASLFALRWS